MPLRPCVSMTPTTTSSPRPCRRSASLSMLNVFPTPGAYPRKSLKIPRDFCGGEATSNQSSGFFGKDYLLRGEPNVCARIGACRDF